eukprot:4114870-Alexandrium_andersonii.AAC.1
MSASLVGSEMCIRDSQSSLELSSELSGALRSQKMRRCLRRSKLELLGPRNCLLYTSDAADDM